MIYVVLGMHKSGTTLVARTLHESGIIMGEEFPAGASYCSNKYEAKWPQSFSDEILGAERGMLRWNQLKSIFVKTVFEPLLKR